MRQIKPGTEEYKKCLITLIEFRFEYMLNLIRSNPDKPIQIVNEGDDDKLPDHPLNFVRYECDKGFSLFPV